MLNDGSMVSIGEAASVLKVAVDTIKQWDKKGLIKVREKINQVRFFDLNELRNVQAQFLFHAENKYQVLMAPSTNYSVIELFSGCGGMALGLSNAGFQTLLLVEIDKEAIATLKSNRSDWNVVHDDVAKVDFSFYRNKVDVIAGGFPCQAFSYAGLGRGFDDTRGTLFFEFLKAVQVVQPKIAIAENVRGLIEHDHGRTLKVMLNALRELGYDSSWKLLRAQFLDVPQKRERLFIIAVRGDLNYSIFFPKEKNYTISLRQALESCPPSQGATYSARKKQVMELVPEGGYWKDLDLGTQRDYMGKSFYLGGGKTGMARRLAWDEPSLTLTTSPAQKQTERCHPAETRPLTVREYARIQTFPDDWQFQGSISSQYKQIGNAVPVNLAFHIGRAVIAMLDQNFDGESMIRVNKLSLNNHSEPKQLELDL